MVLVILVWRRSQVRLTARLRYEVAVIHGSHLPAIRGVLEAPRLPPAAHVMYWERHTPWRYTQAGHPHTKSYSLIALPEGRFAEFPEIGACS
jgi:hypothetical protein